MIVGFELGDGRIELVGDRRQGVALFHPIGVRAALAGDHLAGHQAIAGPGIVGSIGRWGLAVTALAAAVGGPVSPVAAPDLGVRRQDDGRDKVGRQSDLLAGTNMDLGREVVLVAQFLDRDMEALGDREDGVAVGHHIGLLGDHRTLQHVAGLQHAGLLELVGAHQLGDGGVEPVGDRREGVALLDHIGGAFALEGDDLAVGGLRSLRLLRAMHRPGERRAHA